MGIVLGNLCMGISIGWWKDNHYTHHVVTNSVSHDPDIQHPPIMAVSDLFYDRSKGNGKPIRSYYYGHLLDYSGRLAAFLVGHQHFMLYPVMAVARFNLYFQRSVCG